MVSILLVVVRIWLVYCRHGQDMVGILLVVVRIWLVYCRHGQDMVGILLVVVRIWLVYCRHGILQDKILRFVKKYPDYCLQYTDHNLTNNIQYTNHAYSILTIILTT